MFGEVLVAVGFCVTEVPSILMQNGCLYLGRRIISMAVSFFSLNYLGFKNFQVDTSTNQLYTAFKSRSVILVDRRSQELAFRRAITSASILDG